MAAAPSQAQLPKMPHYYFHVFNDRETQDEEGQDFTGLAAATSFAVRAARGLIAEAVTEEGQFNLSHRIDVEDEGHQVVASVRFSDAVTIRS